MIKENLRGMGDENKRELTPLKEVREKVKSVAGMFEVGETEENTIKGRCPLYPFT